MYLMDILPASLESKSKPSTAVCCLLHAYFLFGLLFDPEDGDDMYI
jgi:hypothetical protein